jgi:hypothetical protein
MPLTDPGQLPPLHAVNEKRYQSLICKIQYVPHHNLAIHSINDLVRGFKLRTLEYCETRAFSHVFIRNEKQFTVKCLFLLRTSLPGTLLVRTQLTTSLSQTDQIDLDDRSAWAGSNHGRTEHKERTARTNLDHCNGRPRLSKQRSSEVGSDMRSEYIQSTLFHDVTSLGDRQ